MEDITHTTATENGPADQPHDASSAGTYRRPTEGRIVAGVAAGLADTWNVPVWLVRAGFVITSFGGGFGLVAYLAGWLLMPSTGTEASAAAQLRLRIEAADTTSSKVGLALVGLAALIGAGSAGLIGTPLLVASLLIAGIALSTPSIA